MIHPVGQFDNQAKPYRSINARPLAAAMGAQIEGVQIGRLNDEQFSEIEDALFRHKMIFFRDQNITHADQEAFSRRFGPFSEDAYTEGVEGYPNVQPVIREADARPEMIFGSGWHTDSPFLPRPPAISMLYAVDVPPFGGDTIWANSALAFATLSDTMQELLAPLQVHMSMRDVLATAQRVGRQDDPILGPLAATRGADSLPPDLQRKVAGSFHPLIRTHPKSKERALYCDQAYAIGIKGMKDAEAAPLLTFLVDHITQPVFTCRLRWSPKTLVLWDNRLCVHQAFNDFVGYRRELYRTTVSGETPE